jgi:hypothetical protein
MWIANSRSFLADRFLNSKGAAMSCETASALGHVREFPHPDSGSKIGAHEAIRQSEPKLSATKPAARRKWTWDHVGVGSALLLIGVLVVLEIVRMALGG